MGVRDGTSLPGGLSGARPPTPATALGEPGDGHEGSAPWSALCLRSGHRTVVGDNLLRQEPASGHPDELTGCRSRSPGSRPGCRGGSPPAAPLTFRANGGLVGDGCQLRRAGAALNLEEKI